MQKTPIRGAVSEEHGHVYFSLSCIPAFPSIASKICPISIQYFSMWGLGSVGCCHFLLPWEFDMASVLLHGDGQRGAVLSPRKAFIS